MSNELNLGTLVPSITNNNIVQDQLKNSTFIGIDFGTSTTVISYTITGDQSTPIKSDVIAVRQKNLDGGITVNHLIPSCIAWYNQQLYIGHTAKMLKSKLQYGRNLWYSFKMKLGTDNGPEYVSTELPQGGEYVIEKPLDAVKVFVKYLKNEIDYFIKENNLPSKVFYSISIPASFEANQRKDLKEALLEAGIDFQDHLFIDEPNAAFLSYLIEANANQINGFTIPLDSPLHILVFDFGAGTCDISILEVGRKNGRLYSKNIAISKFEQLGGDDIDKKIVKDILFPQMLAQNGLGIDDIRTPEYNKIILPKLQAVAEYLKVQICKNVASNLVGRSLPTLASSEEKLYLNQEIKLSLFKHELSFSKPELSFKDFKSIMDDFTSGEDDFDFSFKTNEGKSIFDVITSAMTKGNLSKDEIDLVLLIGGSSYNPYIQTALREYFDQSELEIPRDLQAHVSTGAAINSFLVNGLNVDMIKPIVSEPILIIVENNQTKIIVREGTEIPCKKFVIDELHPQKEGQKIIEIPICVSNSNKILTIVKIVSDTGFSKSDKIRLECEISHDKLILFKAFIKDLEIEVEPLNPFSNTALTTEEIAEKKILKSINEIAKNEGGKPPVFLMKELLNFYKKIENFIKVAETYETLQLLEPHKRHETNICFYYSQAGKKSTSDKWAEIAYNNDQSASNAHNLALRKKTQNDFIAYANLMEEAISKGSMSACLYYGQYLVEQEDERGIEYISKAFEYYYNLYKNNRLNKNDYQRLIGAAKELDNDLLADEVQEAFNLINNKEAIAWFNNDNLASDQQNYLPEN